MCVCVCVYLYVSPFPRCLGAEGPSAGFLLLSLLRGPQRLLIIPDLLALPLSASHSGPLRLAQVSSLPMHSFLALFAPSHVQNNPSAWLQPLIAAISETKTVFGARQSRRSVKEKGSNNTCVSVVGVWNHIALTGTTLCFKVFHLWRKVMLQNRSLRASKTENSRG